MSATATPTVCAEPAPAPAELQSLGERLVAGEKITALAKEAGIPWQQLHSKLAELGFKPAKAKPAKAKAKPQAAPAADAAPDGGQIVDNPEPTVAHDQGEDTPSPAAPADNPESTPVQAEGADGTPAAATPAPASFTLIPRNLAALAKLCGDNDRFVLAGVHLVVTPTSYRAEASNGKVAGIVESKTLEDPAVFPSAAVEALGTSANGEPSAVIPAKAWEDALNQVPKRSYKPALCCAGVKAGAQATTFVSTDLERLNVSQPRNLEGNFPEIDKVMPKKPKAVRKFPAKQLIELLRVASNYADPGDLLGNLAPVTIEFHGKDAPVVIRCESGTQKFTGLIMPITPPETIPAADAGASSPAAPQDNLESSPPQAEAAEGTAE